MEGACRRAWSCEMTAHVELSFEPTLTMTRPLWSESDAVAPMWMGWSVPDGARIAQCSCR